MDIKEVISVMVVTSIWTQVTSADVIPQPKFSVPKPAWPDRTYYDEDGPPIMLACHVVHPEIMHVTWFKDDLPVQPMMGQISIFDGGQVLQLDLPKVEQTGMYECVANNSAGSVNHTGYIMISSRQQETRPRITQVSPDGNVAHAVVGDSVEISCEFDVGGSDMALMDLSTDWKKGNNSVNDSLHTTWGINITDTNNQVFSLVINSLKESDYGQYECVGQNGLGNDSKVITVSPPPPSQRKISLLVIIGSSVGGVITIATVALVGLLFYHRRSRRKYEELQWPEPDLKGFHVPEENVQFDVFISYSSDDITWVKNELFQNLINQKYSVCIDFKDFTPGMAVSENIIEAVYKSRKTIVVMSKNFLRSMWGQFELQQAHARAVSLRKDTLVLIKYDQAKVPTKLMGKTFLDWTDAQVQPHFWTRLNEALGEPENMAVIEQDFEKSLQSITDDDLVTDERIGRTIVGNENDIVIDLKYGEYNKGEDDNVDVVAEIQYVERDTDVNKVHGNIVNVNIAGLKLRGEEFDGSCDSGNVSGNGEIEDHSQELNSDTECIVDVH